MREILKLYKIVVGKMKRGIPLRLLFGNNKCGLCRNKMGLCRVCGLLQQPANQTQPSAPHHTDNLKTKAPNTTGSNHLYNTLELLMMGIMVPETC